MKRIIKTIVNESIIPERCRKQRVVSTKKEFEYELNEVSSNDIKVAVRDFNTKKDYYYYDSNFYLEEDLMCDKAEDKLRKLDSDISLKLECRSIDKIKELLSAINNEYLLVDGKMILKKVDEPVISYYEGYQIEEPEVCLYSGIKGYNLLQKEDVLEHVKDRVNLLNISEEEKEDKIRKVKCQLLNIKVLMPSVIKNLPCYHFTYKGHEIKLVDDMWYDARLDVIPYIDVTDIIKMNDEIMNERKLHDVGNKTSILSIDGKLYYDVQNKFLVRITDYKNFKKPIYMD